MLTCLLTENRACGSQLKSRISRHNNSPTLFDDVQSITLNPTNANNAKKFPVLSVIKSWISTNQNSVHNFDTQSNHKTKTHPIPSRKTEIKSDKPQDSANKISVVFIRNNEDKLFKLTFHAVQCSVIPLYAKERHFSVKDNDKNLQAHSKSYYSESYTPSLSKLYTRRKDYLIKQNRDGRNSIMSFKQKIGQHRTTEPMPVKKPTGVSANKTNLKKSIVYLNVQDINFKLYPKIMTIDFSKSLSNEPMSSNLTRDLGLETTDQKKNKGSIIGNCYGDILKFTFSMEDINYQRMTELITRSSQALDTALYIRTFSEISGQVVYVPLPKNNYEYKDPMVKIRRQNKIMQFNKVEPRWMFERRKQRLTTNNLCRQVDPAQKAYEATNGSSILYEGPGTLNKAREGLIRGEILAEDRANYERWIVQSQHETLNQPINEEDEHEKFETTFGAEVPDWDLTVYNK